MPANIIERCAPHNRTKSSRPRVVGRARHLLRQSAGRQKASPLPLTGQGMETGRVAGDPKTTAPANFLERGAPLTRNQSTRPRRLGRARHLLRLSAGRPEAPPLPNPIPTRADTRERPRAIVLHTGSWQERVARSMEFPGNQPEESPPTNRRLDLSECVHEVLRGKCRSTRTCFRHCAPSSAASKAPRACTYRPDCRRRRLEERSAGGLPKVQQQIWNTRLRTPCGGALTTLGEAVVPRHLAPRWTI